MDHGGSGSPIFNMQGQVIGIAEAISKPGLPYECEILNVNLIWEALGLKNPDHADGFFTGVTVGLNINAVE
jgi:hypothetical protein